MSDDIIKCDNENNSCLGEVYQNICKAGYKGPLCEECDIGGVVQYTSSIQ